MQRNRHANKREEPVDIQDEADDDLDLEYVRQAIAEGEDSGVAEGDVFARLRAKHGLSLRK